MWNGINRRKFPRANYKCFIRINSKDSEHSISTQTENIGSGGICVIIKENLGLFQGVALEINIEDKDVAIKCAGTVVWVVKKRAEDKKDGSAYDTGIEFVDIDDASRIRIEKIVDSILKKQTPSA
ncbi:MAG: PilZ domain-containing protein [Candidatus Omnitrophica bacterium]|nr:PilZ domain-containing protein [Candidatus Omnitrophota bacterium]